MGNIDRKINVFLKLSVVCISIAGILVSLTGSCGGISDIFHMKCGRTYLILSICWIILLSVYLIESKLSNRFYKKVFCLVKVLFLGVVILLISGVVPFAEICKNSHMRCYSTMPIELTLAVIALVLSAVQLYFNKKMEG